MPIAIVRATYTEERALETFFTELFGYGRSQVTVSSARYLISLKSGMQ
jgi:hypothetical protein